jgi:hypothetical protein
MSLPVQRKLVLAPTLHFIVQLPLCLLNVELELLTARLGLIQLALKRINLGLTCLEFG